jgi:hypothetical protein
MPGFRPHCYCWIRYWQRVLHNQNHPSHLLRSHQNHRDRLHTQQCHPRLLRPWGQSGHICRQHKRSQRRTALRKCSWWMTAVEFEPVTLPLFSFDLLPADVHRSPQHTEHEGSSCHSFRPWPTSCCQTIQYSRRERGCAILPKVNTNPETDHRVFLC